jgi:hypothetical protein
MMSITRHVMDAVLPHVPTRQWVLSLPHALRYRLAYDHALCRAVHRVLAKAVRRYLRRLARAQGHSDAETGSVTFLKIRRRAHLNLHLHLIGLDGWFHRAAGGALVFERAPTPNLLDVENVVLDVHGRVLRLLEKQGLLEAGADDDLARDAPALAVCYEGAVTQRVGLGHMKGRPVMKLGMSLPRHLASARERVERAGPLCARIDGFDLHGQVAFGAGDRERLQELVRYCARPALANDRLTKCDDGRNLLRLKAPWRDGTTHLCFEPVELMERLAAQIPRPRVNLVLYAGVLARNAKLRKSVVGYARPAPLLEPPATRPRPALKGKVGPS